MAAPTEPGAPPREKPVSRATLTGMIAKAVRAAAKDDDGGDDDRRDERDQRLAIVVVKGAFGLALLSLMVLGGMVGVYLGLGYGGATVTSTGTGGGTTTTSVGPGSP
jgi:hypothetical protein